MSLKGQIKFQIGKRGITPGVLESLRLAFKTRKVVRISVLKGAVRDRERVKEIADEIVNKLGFSKYKFKIIGFTIVIKKSVRKTKSKI